MACLSEQSTFEFFKELQNYNCDDLVISNSNIITYKLINDWTNWNGGTAAIIGDKGSGKTHFAKVWQNKSSAINFTAKELKKANLAIIENKNILIENLTLNDFAEEELFHLLNNLNQARVNNSNQALLITSTISLKNWQIKLPDLASRLNTIIEAHIEQPDDDLLKAVLLKLFSDKQIIIDNNILNYIISKMERSLKFAIKLVDLCDKKALTKNSKINKKIVKLALNELLQI